ncbi:MAG: hypothetical protein HXY30_12930 [Pseudorhodoplanes sp.]|nr:hypothetical protein [Pseudorhodoplanes sp.]
MLLGDLIARCGEESVALESLLSLDNPALTARVSEVCKLHDHTLGEFVALAIRRYAASASDEEWVTAIGAMGRTSVPGRELLRRSLIWMLEAHETADGPA